MADIARLNATVRGAMATLVRRGRTIAHTHFTFGLLLWTDRRVPKDLLVIPLAWSLIGSFAALLLSA